MTDVAEKRRDLITFEAVRRTSTPAIKSEIIAQEHIRSPKMRC